MAADPDHDPRDLHGELAVGADLAFERRWWRGERMVWSAFGALALACLTGLLGRGPWATAHAAAADGRLRFDYERVQRAGTPTTIEIAFAAGGALSRPLQLLMGGELQDGSDLKINPPPLQTELHGGRLLATFAADAAPGRIVVTLKPRRSGWHRLELGTADAAPAVQAVLVLP